MALDPGLLQCPVLQKQVTGRPGPGSERTASFWADVHTRSSLSSNCDTKRRGSMSSPTGWPATAQATCGPLWLMLKWSGPADGRFSTRLGAFEGAESCQPPAGQPATRSSSVRASQRPARYCARRRAPLNEESLASSCSPSQASGWAGHACSRSATCANPTWTSVPGGGTLQLPSCHRRNNSEVLMPPKAKLLDMTVSVSSERPSPVM